MTLLKNIDLFVFAKLDSFKSSEAYQKTINFVSSFTESQQKMIYNLMAVLIVIPPIAIFLLLGLDTYFAKNSVQTKKEILDHIHSYMHQKDRLTRIGNTVFSLSAPTSTNDLQKKIRSIGVNENKLTVKNFKKAASTSSKNITSIEANVTFNDLTMEELEKLLTGLTIKQKMRISNLEINKKKEFLKGSINIMQYGKNKK